MEKKEKGGIVGIDHSHVGLGTLGGRGMHHQVEFLNLKMKYDKTSQLLRSLETHL